MAGKENSSFDTTGKKPIPLNASSPTKSSRNRMPKKQLEAPLSAREQYIKKFCEKHKVVIPSFEQMFAIQVSKGHFGVPLKQLAVFCNGSEWKNHLRGRGKVLEEVAGYFGGNNFLNLQAEINPKQVEKVMLDILEYGSLLHTIKVCEVPDHSEKNGINQPIFQVWDGRHRLVALCLIYGETFNPPVDTYTMEYTQALHACVRSNDTRPIGKREGINFIGLKDGSDAEAAYKKKNGQILPIAKWVAAHSLGMVPDPVLNSFEAITVTDSKAGKGGITVTNYTNTIKEAIGVLRKDINQRELDDQTKTVLNSITNAIERIWFAIDVQSSNTKSTVAWNAYSSIMLGRVIGRAIQYFVASNSSQEDVNTFTSQAAEVIVLFMDKQGNLYARTPANELEANLLHFADAELGVRFPHVEVVKTANPGEPHPI